MTSSECLKLWQAPWLVSLRHTTAGHLVFGQVFSWPNFPTYAAGIMVVFVIEWRRRMQRSEARRSRLEDGG
ncbi:MAG: hypothetical protein JWQ62_928 [Lacunisphaera sp.]|nr:hypothetical protein [Lacunisphaera sp.]